MINRLVPVQCNGIDGNVAVMGILLYHLDFLVVNTRCLGFLLLCSAVCVCLCLVTLRAHLPVNVYVASCPYLSVRGSLQVLEAIAERLRTVTRKSDRAATSGGLQTSQPCGTGLATRSSSVLGAMDPL